MIGAVPEHDPYDPLLRARARDLHQLMLLLNVRFDCLEARR